LREFANNRRRVISDWRIHIVARRLARAENAPLPDERKAMAIRGELSLLGELASVEGVNGVYTINTAYANLLEVSEEQIVQEANPWAYFGYLTAMAYHGITDLSPKEIYAITSWSDKSGRLPLGTTVEDWVDVTKLLTSRMPKRVGQVPIQWTQPSVDRTFGIIVGHSFGIPVYITDVERTLIDVLNAPGKSGGIAKVFEAWRAAEDFDVAKVVSYADAYDNAILRQRVGFVLEKLGRSHPRLTAWQSGLKRGGSVKLVASSPYSDTFSVEWNLSLNVPPSVLAILEGS